MPTPDPTTAARQTIAAARGDLRSLVDGTAADLVYASPLSATVESIALITDIDDIGQLAPDALVVLTEAASPGAWVISAALRYCWERRAAGLIVPAELVTGSARDLAERLTITLFASPIDSTRIALDLSQRLGMARASRLARIHETVSLLAAADSVADALAVLAAALDGRRVSLVVAGRPVAVAGDGAHESAVTAQFRVDERTCAELMAHVSTESLSSQEATQLLSAAVPAIRALLAEQRLQAMQRSLPTLALAAVIGDTAASPEHPIVPLTAEHAALSAGTRYAALRILVPDPTRCAAAVHHAWDDSFPAVALARTADGWLAFVPLDAETDAADVTAALRRRSRLLTGLPVRVGISRTHVHTSAADVAQAVREAGLAARLADGLPTLGVGICTFEQLQLSLLERLMPGDLAAELAALLLPELVAAADRRALIDAVVAVQSCSGSVSAGAKRLGLHRNTVQARLRRAEALGVHLQHPDEVLPVHLLLAALARDDSHLPDLSEK